MLLRRRSVTNGPPPRDLHSAPIEYLRLGRVFVANMTGSVVFLGAAKINNSPGDQLSGATR